MNQTKSIARAFRLLGITMVLVPSAYLTASTMKDSTSKIKPDSDFLFQHEQRVTPSVRKKRVKQAVYSDSVNYWDLVKQESLHPPKIGPPKAAPHHIHPRRSNERGILDSMDTAQSKSKDFDETIPIDSIRSADTLNISPTRRTKEPEPSVERKTGVSDQRVTESHWDVVKRESLAPARKKPKVIHRHPKYPYQVLDTAKNIRNTPADSARQDSQYSPPKLENK